MEISQKIPTKSMAVLCSLAELSDSGFRVILEDARKGHESGNWVYHSLFTFKDYAPRSLEDLEGLPETELADFGFNVLARLLASNRLGT